MSRFSKLAILLPVLSLVQSAAYSQAIGSVTAPATSAPVVQTAQPSAPAKPQVRGNDRNDGKSRSAVQTFPAVAPSSDPLCICHEASREFQAGHYERARVLYEKYIVALKKEQGENGHDVARMYENVGLCHSNLNEYEKAEDAFDKGMSIYKVRKEENHEDAATLLCSLGNCYRDEGKMKEAGETIQRAASILETSGKDDKQLSHVLYCAAYVKRHISDESAAESLYTRAIQLRYGKLGIEDEETVSMITNLGDIFLDRDELDPAVEHFKKAVSIARSHLKDRPDGADRPAHFLSITLIKQKKGDQAAAMYKKLLADQKEAGAAQEKQIDLSRQAGNEMADDNNFDRALPFFEQAAASKKENDLNNLSFACYKVGQFDRSEMLCKEVIDIISKAPKLDKAKLAAAYDNYVKLLRAMKKEEQAKEIEAFMKR